jgi:NADPH:quinone reductase-like Zn-dependent oxidoreductase
MKAARIHHFGSPDVILVEDIEVPEPGEGEVLVRVRAAGVGPWDDWIRSGKSVVAQPLPLTLGSDLSGVVEAVGAGVTEVVPGDAVFGVTNERFVGSYAELAVARASMIAKRPRRLGDLAAASVPVIAVTAMQMLFEYARVRAGQRILIHGGAGNVGAYAVQLARRAGAHVITTITDEADYVRGLGANEVLDRSVRFDEVLAKAPVDAVIDTVGNHVLERSFSIVKRGGVLVSAVCQPSAERAAEHGIEAMFMLVQVDSASLARIATLIDDGQLATRVGSVLPLAEARAAHEMLAGTRPRARGKIVLAVAPRTASDADG